MSDKVYDAIVIGGGPGGSAAATFLGQAGKRVLVLEKDIFPRFHIGESLLPYNQSIFREMGVLPELEKHCTIKKYGAQFHIGNGSKSIALVFKNGKFTRQTEAFQVERATFDHILLNHAEQCGAEVRQGWSVRKFSYETDSVAVEAIDSNGTSHTFRARYLVDASGRGNLTGNQEGIREYHPRLRKLAVFGHFSGVKLDPGTKGGDTVIVRLANKWFWIIPLSAEKISVGCVMDKEEFVKARKSPSEIFAQHWQSSPVLRERMQDAKLIGEIMTTTDFSYRNKRLAGDRLFRVGDAAGFMDPIFSSGVFIAMYSGKLAANTILELLGGHTNSTKLIRRYEARVNRAMDFYWEMVEGFYTTPFMELFMHPREK
ncbi:MAG: NAD(P)/FAD-dependent oxidoreductase, partial [Limisphaerales bacterium]